MSKTKSADSRIQPVAQSAAALSGTQSNSFEHSGGASDRLASASTAPPTLQQKAQALANYCRQFLVYLLLNSLLLGAACGQAAEKFTTTAKIQAPPHGKKGVHALALVGFNYTNRYIDEFSVDGQWGGNMDLSDEASGGSKTTCCASWIDGTYLPTTVHVRWVSSACLAKVTNSFGETRVVASHTYSEVDVQLKGPVPKDPQYFETHFYPDGHVEVAITKEVSEPRLKLPESRRMSRAEEYPPCKERSP